MSYQLEFDALAPYAGQLAAGCAYTLGLTAIATVIGVALGTGCAAARASKQPSLAWLRWIVAGYVELIRNTPFLVQLFFVFFGLPAAGMKLSADQAALLAMVLNLGAYSTEIVRAGIEAVPRGQIEAALSLAMNRWQIFRYVVLKPAFAKIWPALVSQIVIVMLGSAAVSQIAAQDLTFVANFVQSRNFRAFESYFVATALYLLMALAVRQLLLAAGQRLFVRR